MLGKSTISSNNQWIFYLFGLIFSLVLAYLIGHYGYQTGVILAVAGIGLPMIFLCFIDFRIGYVVLIILSWTLPQVGRLIRTFLAQEVPLGTVMDLMMWTTFLGFLIQQLSAKNRENWKAFRHPIVYLYIIGFSYMLIQIVNPNAVGVRGWLQGFRFEIYAVFGFMMALHYFSKLSSIKMYLKIWIGFAILASSYGLWQEYVGLMDWEDYWVRTYRDGTIVFGRIRKWSFLNGPTEFGMISVITALFCFVMAMNNKMTTIKRAILIGFSVIMVVSTVYTGTRTAYAMLPAGIFLYILMTMNSLRSMVISAVVVLSFAVVYFGPFYGPNVLRIRSAFQGNEDPSMNVRSVNRASVQPYLYTHPIGGGIMTTEKVGSELSPGHPLNGFPPDSGYLSIALERGPIGLIINMLFHMLILITGIKGFYRSRDPLIKHIFGGITVSFFTLCIANFAQFAMNGRPMDILLFSAYAIIINLTKINESE